MYEEVESTGKPDIEEFLRLSDSIFWDTLFSDDEDLQESRKILEDISSRRLYSSLSLVRVDGDKEVSSSQFIHDTLYNTRSHGSNVLLYALNDEQSSMDYHFAEINCHGSLFLYTNEFYFYWMAR